MHSAGDYYPVVVAVVDNYDLEHYRRYEISYGERCETRYTPERAEKIARAMHARITRGET